MDTPVSTVGPRRAIVLGGGGVAGIAWESALLSEFLSRGIAVNDADVVVGTSAGSVVGAALRSGQLVSWASDQAAPAGLGELSVAGIEEFLTAAGVAARSAAGEVDARAAVGALARSAMPEDDGASVLRFAELLPIDHWPAGELRVTAVDATDGSFTVFDRTTGTDLATAIAASCAVPGVYPVVPIGGRAHMDGGARSVTNADMAADCDRILVISCGPEPEMSPLGPTLTQAVASLREGSEVFVVEADAASLAAFGTNSLLLSTREPAAQAGRLQGGLLIDEVRQFWNAG